MPRVQIGSKYEGPELDRPVLRQMPRHWQLDTEEPEPAMFPFVLKALVIVGGFWILSCVALSLGANP